MVLPASHRISRVPWYSGSLPLFSSVSSTGLSPSSAELSNSVRLPLTLLFTVSSPRYLSIGLGSFLFARRYSENYFCFLFLRVLRCFSSPRSPHTPIYSVHDTYGSPYVGFPIRTSMDLRSFAAPHGFSQLTTSFFGS